MEVSAVSKNLKMIAFWRCPVPEPGKPNQGHYDRPAIDKVNSYGIVSHSCRLSAGFLYFSDRRTHTNS